MKGRGLEYMYFNVLDDDIDGKDILSWTSWRWLLIELSGQYSEIIFFHLFTLGFPDHTRCNAWVLDGDLFHKGLQKFAVSQDNLANTMILLVVDMSRPWLAIDSLQKWGSVVREHVDKLRIVPETMRDMEQRCKSGDARACSQEHFMTKLVHSDVLFVCKFYTQFW